jgi:hypothetical protein
MTNGCGPLVVLTGGKAMNMSFESAAGATTF